MVASSIFLLYACNAGTVDGTDIARSLVAIGREVPCTIDISPSRSREDTSEGHHSSDHFEAASTLMFRQLYLFNILVSKRWLRHRDLLNKGKIAREFDTGNIVVVKK